MACPFFDPVQPRGSAWDLCHAMLPLGDSWAGMCLAGPESPAAPDDYSLHHICNLGYARGRCRRFPEADVPDAVRFALADAAGGAIQVRWSAERDHQPAAHGTLLFDRATGAIASSASLPAAVSRLAAAYIASYRRRKDLEP
jgi:hypothetical protein